MANFYSGWVAPPSGAVKYRIRLTVTVVSQDIEANTSTLSWSLRIEKDRSDLGFYNYPGASWHVYINGSTRLNGSGTKPDASWPGTATWLLGSGTYTVTHEDDGTMLGMPVDADFTRTASGYAPSTLALSGTPTMDLPTIPRATIPTVDPVSGDTGSTYTIEHVPASSDFYHDVAYSLDDGDTFTDIVTDVVGTDTSTDWTPAHSLLPDDTSVTAIIRVITRASSGGAIIGTKTVNLPLTVPSSVKPTVSSVAWSDDQTSAPDLPTLMGGSGRFVQRWSLLEPAVTAAGTGGSTIVGSEVIQNGQTTASGSAFGLPIALSGAVPFSVVATDSRGRTNDPYTDTVTVKAYNYPNLPTPSVVRTSDSGGATPDPAGTYLKVAPAASVSSLNFGDGEKNLLEWRVRTRPAGGSWTTNQDWTAATVSGNVWTTPYILAGFSASSEFEVEVSIRDVFGKNGYSTSQTVKTLTVPVPSESVFEDRVKEGKGYGRYHSGSGAFLQVAGGAEIDEIESAAITQGGVPVVDDTGLAAAIAAAIALAAPTGKVDYTVAATAPTGWLLALGGAFDRTTYADLFEVCNPIVGTFNVTIATPGVATLNGHGLYTGQMVYLTTTGALPTGLSANVAYYVIRVDANTFRLATSLANANASTPINTTGSQSGTHTIRRTYGVGDGSTTFNVPNVGGRVLVGVDTAQAEFDALGSTGGEKAHTLTDAELPPNTYPTSLSVPVTAGAGTTNRFVAASVVGGGQAHNNLQPYITLTAIIKT